MCDIVERTVKLDKRVAKFVHSMTNSKNSAVRKLIEYFLTTESSVFTDNCRDYMYKFDISVFAWYESLHDAINFIIPNLCDEHASKIASIKELYRVRDKVIYSELNSLQANTFIQLICNSHQIVVHLFLS